MGREALDCVLPPAEGKSSERASTALLPEGGAWPVSGFCFAPSGTKSMQGPDSWCGGDMPLPGGRQSSWEEEEDVEIGMWHSSGSAPEGSASTHWPPYVKKMPSKVSGFGGRAEPSWGGG